MSEGRFAGLAVSGHTATRPAHLLQEAVALTRNPKTLGSWPTRTVSAIPLR